jgi:probable rRNA maturation factor
MEAGTDNIVVDITQEFKGVKLNRRKLAELVTVVCGRFGVSVATVSVVILGDEAISKINGRFLNQCWPTDVVSFDLSDDGNNSKTFEIVVNGEMAIKEAKARGHSSQAELALYLTHGLLHNLGFDDSDEAEAGKMHDTEDDILQKLGYGIIYRSKVK